MRAPRAAPLFALAALGWAERADAQWKEVPAPDAAPVEALAVSPVDGRLIASLRATPESLYVRGGFGWSDDEGTRWERNYDPQAPVFADIATHPLEPNVMWGAKFAAWTSATSGRTWHHAYSHFNWIEAVAVDPLHPKVVYATGTAVAPGGTLHRSFDGGHSWHSTSPLFFVDHFDVAVLADGTAGPGTLLLASGNGIHRSVDAGQTVTQVMTGQKGVQLGVTADNPLVAWCRTLNGTKTRLWKSTDGGVSWTKMPSPANDLKYVTPHATDPSRAFAVSTKKGALYTLDGGLTWLPSTGLSPMADLHSIVLSPTDPATLFAGDQGALGGVWRSYDAGLSWERTGTGLKTGVPELHFDGAGALWGSGLNVPLHFDGLAWTTPAYAFGSTSTAASLSVHPGDPATVAWVDEKPAWNQFNRVAVTVDGGGTWSDVTPPSAQNGQTEVNAVAFDANGTLVAVCQFGDVYRSPDLGATWARTTNPSTWSFVRELVIDPSDPSRMFVGDDTKLFRSLDQGASWTRLGLGPHFEREPMDLALSPASPAELFVLAGTPVRRPYRSFDGGDTWSRFGAGLPETGVTRLALDPTDPTRLVAGTLQRGAWLSVDGGATFTPWSEGLGERHVLSVAFDPQRPGRVWLSTGEGAFYLRDLS